MVFEYLRGHEAWSTHQPPGTLRGNELTDPIIRELDIDRVLSNVAGGWNNIQGVGKSPHKDIVTLQVTVDNGIGMEIFDCRGNLE